MSSYLASFTSSSSISNALGSRLNSLRRAITLGDEGDDPENEDCSHISNALRAYYTEKGRPFPSWLPPDPKASTAAATRPIATASSGQYGQAPAGAYGRGGGLSDIWGDSGAPSPGSAQTSSLRRGRGSGASGASGSGLAPSQSTPPGPVMSPRLSSRRRSLIHLHQVVCIPQGLDHCPASVLGPISRRSLDGLARIVGPGQARRRNDCGQGCMVGDPPVREISIQAFASP